MKLAIVAATVLLAAAGPDRKAPREIRLSLREAVYSALNHNLDVEISRYQPWIEDRNMHAAWGAFDHHFYADSSVGRSLQATTSALAGAPRLDSDQGLLKTGLRRTLPFGASYDLYFSSDRQATNSTYSTINPRWQDTLALTLTVPLWRGRGEGVNLTPVLLARNSRRLAVAQFEKSLADAVFAVQDAYWSLVAALEVKKFREQSLEVANRLLDDNRKRFERGVLARVDVTQAEAGVAGQVEGILTAEKAVQDAMDLLKRLVDPALLREETVIVPLDAPRAPEGELDERQATESGLADAFANRPEYRQVAVQVDSQALSLEKARDDCRPRLNAVAGGALNGVDDGFGSAHSELANLGTYSWSLGLSLEIPLEGRASEGAFQKAELERRRLVLQRRNLEDQILLEVRQAVREIKTVEKRIEATRKARLLAREQFEGEMNRRDQGLRTTFHVLDAQSRLSEAMTNEVRALVDHAAAQARYRRSTGTLLKGHDILVDQNLDPRQAVR